jgi:intracellular sulfur oxidation DsrE/DsrF family protein
MPTLSGFHQSAASLRRLLSCAAGGITLLALVSSTGTQAADDAAALRGLHEVKVAYDLTEEDGKRLLNQISVIEETRQSLIAQGTTPHFVLAFRGPATRLVQSDTEKIKPEDRALAAQIAAKLDAMSKAPGVDSMEQCAIAVRQQGTKAENVIPPIKVVGNAWISLMSYQNRGYAYIRP